MDAGDSSNAGDTQRHVCGLCWTSFSSPTELQQHCLQCFSEDCSETRASDDGPPDEETKDNPDEGNCDPGGSPPNVGAADDTEEPDDGAAAREDSPSTSSLPDSKTLHLCKLCPKTFTNYGSYRRHLRMHSCGHRYTCDICGKQFFRRYLWIKHYEKIHNSVMQNMCQCCTCEVWLKNSDTLKEHIRTKHRYVQSSGGDIAEAGKKPADTIVLDSISLKPICETDREMNEDDDSTKSEERHISGTKCQWMCNLCTDMFVTKAHLMKHKEDKHGRKRSWVSKAASPEVDVKQKLDQPMQDLFQDTLSELSIKRMLTSDMMTEKPKKESNVTIELPSTFSPTFAGSGLCDPTKRGVFLCEVCKKTFINRSSYLRHKKMHTGVRPYICEQCCMSFFRSESLTTHKRKHTTNDPYKCFVCGHEEISASNLSSHFISTHSKLPEEYESNAAARSKCCRPSKYAGGKMLMYQAEMQQAPSVSPKDKNIESQDCDANSDDTVLASLNGDVDSPSAAADKYTCLVCFKFFPDEQAYYDHQCHDDFLPVGHQKKDSSSQEEADDPVRMALMATCKLCLEKFSSEEDLFRHMVTHITCWSCICGYCGRYFPQSEQLTEHLLVDHSSEDEQSIEQYCCFHCKQKFEEGNALRGHVLEVHDTVFCLDPPAYSSLGHKNESQTTGKDNGGVYTKMNEKGEFQSSGYRCEGCGTSFRDFKSSMLHFRDKHSTVITIGGLPPGAHLKSVVGGKECCTKCSEPLTDSMGRCGSASPCNLCSRTFSDASEAHTHQQENHLLVDWFCCDACDASGPRDIMEKHVLSHLTKVGSLVLPEGVYRPSFMSDTTEPFWKVQEAFLDWCKNGSSKAKSCHSNGKVACAAETRTKTRSEILIEEAKRCTIEDGHVIPTPKGYLHESKELSKDIIDLLPKNGEITMIPIKKGLASGARSETGSFSQLRSALTRSSGTSSADRNGNILKALLGEKKEPCEGTEHQGNVSDIEAFFKATLSEGQSPMSAADQPWVECTDLSDNAAPSDHREATVVLKCEDCKRLFTHYSSWKRHRRQHLGLNTHKCGDCHREFYRKDQFDKHIKSHKITDT